MSKNGNAVANKYEVRFCQWRGLNYYICVYSYIYNLGFFYKNSCKKETMMVEYGHSLNWHSKGGVSYD